MQDRAEGTAQARQGRRPCKIELMPMEVFTCTGEKTEPCGEFVHLGTQIDPSSSATPEVRRCCSIARSVFDSLQHLCNSAAIDTRVKGQLYCALPFRAVLQCWNMADNI